MRKPPTMTMRSFMTRMLEINQYLSEFPPHGDDQQLPQDEILDIGEFAVPNAWQREMTIQNFDPIAGTVSDLVDFCERMECTEGTTDPDKKKEDKLMKNCIPCKSEKTKGSWCEICQMNNHNTKDCFRLKRMREECNKEQSSPNKHYKSSWKKDDNKKDYKKQTSVTKEQVHMMVERALKRQLEKHGSPGLRQEPMEDSFNILNPKEECEKNLKT